MRERTQITNFRNERWDITTDPFVITKIIQEYNEQVYANKHDILDEMD